MYVFGLGFMFYCGLYVWKCFLEDICLGNGVIGFIYNIIIICYIVCLFLYFVLFYVWKNENIFVENFFLFFIFLVNVCVWLDVIFFELGDIFNELDNDNFLVIKNVIEFLNRVIEVIEKIELFLFFVLIEFFLFGIDLFFMKIFDNNDNNVNMLYENLRN